MKHYVIKAEEIEAMAGVSKTHFLNPNAKRNNKSLGDLTGLMGIGVHLIEVPPGCLSTEFHVHHHEDECAYVLSGSGIVRIGEDEFPVAPGDFIGYRAGGLPHTMVNTSDQPLRCLVVGERLSHDVGDYPHQSKRIFRHEGLSWQVVDIDAISYPNAGKK